MTFSCSYTCIISFIPVATFNTTLETLYIRPVWYALFLLRIFIDSQVWVHIANAARRLSYNLYTMKACNKETNKGGHLLYITIQQHIST